MSLEVTNHPIQMSGIQGFCYAMVDGVMKKIYNVLARTSAKTSNTELMLELDLLLSL
jgi:hypothetical protein